MSVQTETVVKVAHLARIRIAEERLAPLAGELARILDWVEQLNEVDCDGVEPMTSAVAVAAPLREDAVNDGGDAPAVLRNAPEAEEGFFAVPKVVE